PCRERSQRRRLILAARVHILDAHLLREPVDQRAVLAGDEGEEEAASPPARNTHYVEEVKPLAFLAVRPPPEPTVSQHSVDVEGDRANLRRRAQTRRSFC